MELRHLRYFTALADCLSFTRAAERVHVTQSTLSHQIRQLEDEVGQPLFERIGRRVVTTEGGELFRAFAARSLREVDDGVAMLRPGGGGLSGQVRIGATYTFNISLIPDCVASFLARHPTVQVRVEELAGDEIASRLRSGRLDLGIAYRPGGASDLWFEPLYNEEMVLVVADNHPLARRKRIRMVELHQQPLVLTPDYFSTRSLLEDCFKASGAEPVVVAEMSSVAPMLGLVLRMPIGTIVAVNAVPSALTRLRMIPIESPTPVRTPGILWRAEREAPAAVQSFAVVVRKTALGNSLTALRSPVGRRSDKEQTMATTRNGKTGGEPGKGKATGGDASAAAARPVTQPRQKATGQKVSKERGSSTRKKNPGKRPRQGGS